MIVFDRVSKSFPPARPGGPRKVILDDARFALPDAASIGILAPNGSGKTTLINMIYGVERPDRGRIHRSGSISFPLGFMHGLTSKLSGTQNVRSMARIMKLCPDIIEAFTRAVADIGADFDRPVGKMSQGTRARLSFGLLLALDFDTYLIDEGIPVTTDEAFNARAQQILMARIARGSAIVVSHDPEVIKRYCSHTCSLAQGALSAPVPV